MLLFFQTVEILNPSSINPSLMHIQKDIFTILLSENTSIVMYLKPY